MDWPPVPELLEDLREGRREPTDVVGEALDRIAERDPAVGAFTCVNGAALDRADALEAEGPDGNPLHGLPVAVKDNQATADLPTTHGSALMEGHQTGRDHPAVERLREAGAVVVGKTNLAPFALLAVTHNDLHGPTRNPWDLDRSPGGSSGGSAAAVAAGMVPAATGSDGGGSLRIPGACCGIPALKPSRGRVPDAGGPPLFQDLSVPGVLTPTVAGTAALLDVVAGPHPRDPDALPAPVPAYADTLDREGSRLDGVRVAYAPNLGGRPVDPAVRRRVDEAVEVLGEAGADVEAVEPDVPVEDGSMVTKTAVEARAFLDEEFEAWEEELWPPLVAMAQGVDEASPAEYVRARDAGRRLWEAVGPLLEDHDLLATPTMAVPPFGAEEIGPEDVAGEPAGPLGWMPFTFPFNFTGQPAASVPAGLTGEDLPVGLQLVGPPMGDRAVLGAAGGYMEERFKDGVPDAPPTEQ